MVKLKAKFGGGSGGGAPPVHMAQVTGSQQIVGNQVEIVSQPPIPPAIPLPCVTTVLAAGIEPEDGLVNIRGTAGVRITAGPIEDPPTYSPATQGVEIMVSEEQMVTIQRGLLPTDQIVEMSEEGITLSSGGAELTLTAEGQIVIESLSEITLAVAGGAASISLTPEGITITGVLVEIN
jgi:hypothetical protein